MLNLLTDLTTWIEGFYNSQYAALILGIIALAESIFFPIIPDIFLISISILKPETAIWMALITVIGSITGAVIGYHISKLIGIKFIHRFIKQKHLESAYNLFQKYGIWVILIAAFTPIPYKIFVIAAGFFQYNFKQFIIASIIGRSVRFMTLGVMLYFAGDSIRSTISNQFETIIIIFTIILILALIIWIKLRDRILNFFNMT